MEPRRDEDPYRAPDSDPSSHPRASLLVYATSIGAAIACDSVVNLPLNVLRPGLQPAKLWAAMDVLLLGYNVLVGYVGGRLAARHAAVSHEDARAQWNLAAVVTATSFLLGTAAARFAPHVQTAAAPVAPALVSLLTYAIEFSAVVLLVRFGYAIGTFRQALLEGARTARRRRRERRLIHALAIVEKRHRAPRLAHVCGVGRPVRRQIERAVSAVGACRPRSSDRGAC